MLSIWLQQNIFLPVFCLFVCWFEFDRHPKSLNLLRKLPKATETTALTSGKGRLLLQYSTDTNFLSFGACLNKIEIHSERLQSRVQVYVQGMNLAADTLKYLTWF